MAIAVNSTRLSSGQAAGSGVYAVTLGATPAFGSALLISLASSGNTATITSIDDRYGNTYVQVFDSGNNSLAVRTYLWICKAQHDLVSGDTINLRTTAAGLSYAIDEVTGLGSAHVPDVTQQAFDTNAVSAFSTGASAATAYSNELVWAVIGTPLSNATTQTVTAGTGYTQQGARVTGTQIVSLYTEYKIVAATGAQTADGAINTTASKYVATLVTLPDPQSPESTYRAVSAVRAEAAAIVGLNRGASFIGTEIAAAVGVQRGVSFIGIEVAGSVSEAPPASTSRRPMPIIAG